MGKSNSYRFGAVVLFIFSFFITVCSSAKPHAEQYTNLDGLSNNSVNCIFEDSKHTLWVGTWDGLNCFDGRSFQTFHYNPQDRFSVSNNVIRQVVEQDSMHFWISTDYGINCFDRNEQKFYRFFFGQKKYLPLKEQSFQIALTPAKEIIAFVRGFGFFYFDRLKHDFFHLNYEPDLKGLIKFQITSDSKIHLFYENGDLKSYPLLYQFFVPRFALPVSCEHKVDAIFRSNGSMIIKKNDSLYVNNMQHPLLRLRRNAQPVCVSYTTNSLIVGYAFAGYDRYDLRNNQFVYQESGYKNMTVFTAFQGSQNILWLGSDGKGLFQLRNRNTSIHSVAADNPVRCFCQLSATRLLVGTKGSGLQLFDKSTQKLSPFYRVSDGLLSDAVYCMNKNRSGDIFIGTEEFGLNYLSGKDHKLHRLDIPCTNYFQSVYSMLFTDNDSVLWLGTSGYGLIKLRLQKRNGYYHVLHTSIFKTDESHTSYLNSNVIYAILPNSDNRSLLLGTRGTGIVVFDKQTHRFGLYKNENVSPSRSYDVLSLAAANGSFWVGTSYGLYNYREYTDTKTIAFTTAEGLSNNTVHAVLKDSSKIWISTNNGIDCLNQTTHKIDCYSIKDGLQNNEFADGAYFKDQQGLLYFGCPDGFSYFDPANLKIRNFEPSIDLVGFSIFNTPQNLKKRIVAKHLNLADYEAYVAFKFIAHDFINNSNCRYQYKLENFSDEWIDNGTNPNVVFTKLSPGKYVLKVRATNGDGVLSNHLYTLTIRVAYPWWFSLQAFIVYLLLVYMIAEQLLLAIKNRMRLKRRLMLDEIDKRNQLKVHESKLQFFTNVAHEFFTPLTLIYAPAQYLLKQVDLDEHTRRYIRIIKNNADRMQKLISELMEFRKAESGHLSLHPESIDVKLLIDYITDNYIELARQSDIDFSVELENVSQIISDRNSIEKILFNLLSNAFKYASLKGYIRLWVKQDTDNLYLTIRNSSEGLTAEQMSQIFNRFRIFDHTKLENATATGVGLNLTKNLTEILGGTIKVDSKLHEYVEFSLLFPSMTINPDPANLKNENNDISTIQTISNMPEINGHEEIQKDRTVLIVEDEPAILQLISDLLSPYYHVLTAADGKIALNILASRVPDLIISDVLMPNMDGITLLDTVRSNRLTEHIPVINISAKTTSEDHVAAYQHGADLYIAKPFHPNHILAAVTHLLAQQATLKEYFGSSRSSVTFKDGLPIHKEDEAVLQEIIAYIENNMDDDELSLDDLAGNLAISKATLYRKLKDLTGKTPSEFIRSTRLNFAAHLLITTKLTVSQIMFKSGFSNKSYFYREFAKQYNLSPGEYRKTKTNS